MRALPSYAISFLSPHCPLVALLAWTVPSLFARALLRLVGRDMSWGVDEGNRSRAGSGVEVSCPVETSPWNIYVEYMADTLPRNGHTALQQGSSDEHGVEHRGLSGRATLPLGEALGSQLRTPKA